MTTSTAVSRRPLEGVAVPPGFGFVTEAFSAIQGEGPFVGYRQLFIRFGGCDLRCAWCDTPGSLVRRGPGSYEVSAGSRHFEERDNPIQLQELAELVLRLQPERHHAVSFTGGEPLLQPEAVRYLAEEVHKQSGRTLLETHGGLVDELEKVVSCIDIVSMDIKLPSSAGDWVALPMHRAFLALALRTNVYAKIVVTPSTRSEEVVEAARMVASASPHVELILQPVTPAGLVRATASPELMLQLQQLCLDVHGRVRVIPQTHKFMGQR
jgi:organic radical activating enzyme